MKPFPSCLRLLLAAFALFLVAGCGSTRLWPFGEPEARSTVPENAALYACNAGKRFYLRFLAGGDAWVILPEREFRLARGSGPAARRYSNGVAVLDLGADAAAEATLNDGPAMAFSGCKAAAPK